MTEAANSPRLLQCVAVLGRRDEPTDAVESYCQNLAEALACHNIRLRLHRAAWAEEEWSAALADLQQELSEHRPDFAMLQYTALAWSRRGFPLGFLRLMRALRKSGTRCAVVFHDAAPYEGTRIIDQVRRHVQQMVMRAAARRADLTILTVPANTAAWLPSGVAHCVSIPVGANLRGPEAAWKREKEPATPSVAVFSVTGGATDEVRVVADAVRHASARLGELRLAVFGRNADAFEPLFREELADARVQLSVQGVTDETEILEILHDAGVFLFVRGHISSRRSSAIAGIACGLPVIAREGPETGPPITEAGVILLPPRADGEAFGAALVRVLSDREYAAVLGARSREAYLRHFSWPAIAARYAAALGAIAPERQAAVAQRGLVARLFLLL